MGEEEKCEIRMHKESPSLLSPLPNSHVIFLLFLYCKDDVRRGRGRTKGGHLVIFLVLSPEKSIAHFLLAQKCRRDLKRPRVVVVVLDIARRDTQLIAHNLSKRPRKNGACLLQMRRRKGKERKGPLSSSSPSRLVGRRLSELIVPSSFVFRRAEQKGAKEKEEGKKGPPLALGGGGAHSLVGNFFRSHVSAVGGECIAD